MVRSRRKQIVVNQKYQYQHGLLVVALTVLGTNLFLILRLIFPGDAPFVLNSKTAAGLGVAELVLIAGAWYGSLRMTHRVAGPMFVIAREIARLGRGDLTAHITLREKDMFREEACSMNDSFAALRERVAAIQEIAARLSVTGNSEAEGTLAELRAALAELHTGEPA